MSVTATELSALTRDQIDLVFPLAREADRELSLEAWREFAAPRVARDPGERPARGGLLAARNGRVRGLTAYDIVAGAGHERILSAFHTIIVDRTRERQLVPDLLGGLMRIAEHGHCMRLCVELPRSSRWLRSRWSDPDGRIFRLPVECRARSLTPAAAPAAGTVLHFRPRLAPQP